MSLAAIMMEKAMPYVPHEVIVSLVLPRLPVASLLRFRFVCKAWRDTIDNDDDFHRQHLRLQNSSVLIALQVPSRAAPHGRSVTTATLYWLEDSQKDAATLVHDMPYYHASPAGVAHDLAHCDGLVLLPTDTKVRVLNPATRRFVTLPWSTHGVTPDGFSHGHQAFGLGHDPSSNTYKVARFFYCSKHDFGMEVFTIGGEHRWRETAARPLYPVKPGRTATFFKGSLIWTVEEEIHRDAPGFLRFCLEDELSSIMAPPPCWSPRLVYVSTSLAEIRGELCVCVPRLEHGYETMEMWMCGELGNNNVPAQWDRRYVLANVPFFRTYRSLRLIGIFNEEIMFGAESYRLWFYSRPQGVLKGAKSIMDLKFHDPNIDILVEYTRENLTGFDAIPFVPSLVPV